MEYIYSFPPYQYSAKNRTTKEYVEISEDMIKWEIKHHICIAF